MSQMVKDVSCCYVDMDGKSHRSRALKEWSSLTHKRKGMSPSRARRGGNRQGRIVKPAEWTL